MLVRSRSARAPGRKPNTAYRNREYLNEDEIKRLLDAAGKSCNPVRDRLFVLLCFRHALRVSELVGSPSTSSI